MLNAIIGTVAACGAASLAGLHTMAPWSQLYGANFLGLEPGSKQLALTYDDGPNEPYTQRLLEVLARHNAKATFFLMGKFVKERPQIVRAVVEAGHEIGNHSWDHPNLIFCSGSKTRRQIEDTQRAIEDACGVTPKLFRPPFGGRRPGTFTIARELGLTPVMWRVTCYDWSAKSPDSILAKARRGIRGGDVILLHDGGHVRLGTNRSLTVEATESLVSEYVQKGFRFVCVSEMLSSTLSQPAVPA
jgi:peptidoglycan/xylan/chitin deacetylase (PgdA/CDA1 family)